MEGIRIEVSGAQGVGKTTLIKELKKYYPEFYTNTYGLRSIFKDKEKSDYADTELQLKILNYQRDQILFNKYIFEDRGVLDGLAYMNILNKEGKSNLPYEVYKYIEQESIYLLKSPFVDAIVLVPVEFELVDDGFRNTDRERQLEANRLMEYYIDTYDLRYKTVVPRGTVEERTNTVRELVERLKKEKSASNP